MTMVDQGLCEACQALRDFVENPNKRPDVALRGVFQVANPRQWQTVKTDTWEVGYRVYEVPPFVGRFRREVALRRKDGGPIDEVPENERGAIVSALYEAFLDHGAEIPQIGIAHGKRGPCLVIIQDFMPVFQMCVDPVGAQRQEAVGINEVLGRTIH